MTAPPVCQRCGHLESFHHKECVPCGCEKVYTTGRTGKRLESFRWICPAFVPPPASEDGK